MAATAWLFDNTPHTGWVEGALNGLLTGTYKIALLTAVPAQSAANWAAISGTEVSGTGYTAGGATLGTKTCTVSGHVTSSGWANVTWSSSTITAKAAVVYDSVSGELLMCVNLNAGADVSSVAGDFTISWTSVSNVAFTVTVATAS